MLLPNIEDFRPDDSGMSPLARHEEWYRRALPEVRRAGAGARPTCRDTFLDSAWYFLRYPSTELDDVPFDPSADQEVAAGDSYIGGNEHAVLHLLYSRFITMVLHDQGHLDFEEPFTRSSARTGMIVRDGAKMSKTQGQRREPRPVHRRSGARTRSAPTSCSSARTRRAATSATRAERAAAVPRQGLGAGGSVLSAER